MVTVSYLPSIVTMALCCSISKIKQDIGRKCGRYVHSFWHDPQMWQTDEWTDTAWRHIPRLCIASRSKITIFTYPSLHFLFVLFALGTQKIVVFTYRSPHFCFPWRRTCDYHAICCMDGKTIQCLPNPSQHVPIYLQQFPSYTMLKSMRKSKNRYFYHIFVSPRTPLGQSR